MKKLLSILLFLLALMVIVVNKSQAQSAGIHGLWLIEQVQVGNEEMTPVAKWTRIHSDGTYESGNGWLKNSEGTWEFDEIEETYLPKETNGLEDPFGAFEVQFEGNRMSWSREEEGREVVVTLKRINELPKAPADQVQGLWDLVKATKEEASIIKSVDPEGLHYLFIRWDRIYVERTAEGKRQTGYWHMHGHRPDITLMSHNSEIEPVTWRMKINKNNELVLQGISPANSGQVFTYTRLNKFPK